MQNDWNDWWLWIYILSFIALVIGLSYWFDFGLFSN